MKHSVLPILLIIFTFGFAGAGYAQSADTLIIRGKIIDDKNKEALPFANVVLEQDKKILAGYTTDFEGGFTLRVPVANIKADKEIIIRASYVGYKNFQTKWTTIPEEKMIIEMSASEWGCEPLINIYIIPIDKDNPSTGHTWNREDIERLPLRQ